MIQRLGDVFRPFLVEFYDLGPNAGMLKLDLLGQSKTDIATAGDNDAPALLLFMAKGCHGTPKMGHITDKIHLISG